MTKSELYDYMTAANEAHAEVSTQYCSEVALYGDAWPGAWLDVQKASLVAKAANKEWSRRYPVKVPTLEELRDPTFDFGDILY